MDRAPLGIVALLVLAFLCSEDRRRIPWRTVIAGLLLQVALALLLLRVPPATRAVFAVNDAATALQNATLTGTQFVFGYLGGPPLPFAETHPGASFILAFQALPLVLTISALASLLFHWGVLQRVTAAFAWLLRRVDGHRRRARAGCGGACVRRHGGSATAGAPLPGPHATRRTVCLDDLRHGGRRRHCDGDLRSFLSPIVPNALGNILIASVISTPAGLAIAALMVPFGEPESAEARLVIHDPPHSALDAVVKGTLDGIPILASIIAVLIVAVAVVALVNMAFGLLPLWDDAPVTLQRLFALPFRPVMWLIGVPWQETGGAATLMATKTVLNEFVAYLNFSTLPPGTFSPRTRIILTYALCGFANFGSLGIMIGGIGAMVPERRHEIVALGMRSILSGTLATCISGALAGLLI